MEKKWRIGGLVALGIAAAAGAAVATALTLMKKQNTEDEITKAAPEEDTEDDAILVDLDGDGEVDAMLEDLSGDGNVDTVTVDTTGDGEAATGSWTWSIQRTRSCSPRWKRRKRQRPRKSRRHRRRRKLRRNNRFPAPAYAGAVFSNRNSQRRIGGFNMYDICIIGGGPAGMTAALYSARAGRSTVILEEKTFGGQMGETSMIENMPGSPNTEGWELAMKFSQQVMELPVEAVYEKAEKIESLTDHVKVTTSGGQEIEARRLILAIGVKRRRLGVPGEDLLTGKGISFCAVCDGAFFRGKDVAVVGGGNTALEDALYLSGICSRVYLVVRKDYFRGQEALQQRVREKENIEVCFETRITAVHGAGKVSSVTMESPTGSREVELAGVFVAIGLSPDTSLYGQVVDTTPEGYISTDERMQTSDPLIYAAGDIRSKEIRQIVTALGDGAIAAEMAGRSL